MEMASAHGLALKLVEMNRLDRITRNECEIISEEDKIIKIWYIACQSRFSKDNFFTLLRKTMIFVLSPNSLKEQKKKELLKGACMYFNQFSDILNSLNIYIRKPFIDAIVDPWKNKHFSWEELFQKRINVFDLKVQQYFEAEPEEIVLARVHFFAINGKDDMSMVLAKNSFLFHCRVNKTFKYLTRSSKTIIKSSMSRKGIPSMDWYIHNLQQKKTVNALFNEVKQLTCHEGVLLIMRMRGLKYRPFALSFIELFLMIELIYPSKFCCTKKLFTLWAILYKDMQTPMEIVSEDIKKLIAAYAPTSSHFYLLVDAFWEQFGMTFLNIYIELYIRALTTDLNILEVAKHQDKHEDVNELESHLSSMFYKLSTLFIDYHQRVARECMFSAFSLRPTKKFLYILQSITHGILSEENDMKGDSSFNLNIASNQECKCAIKCTGFCKSMKEHALDHPILMKGIPKVPYSVVKDLVSVLESVRCFNFQYNVFDWRKNAIDLSDYQKDSTTCRSYESDTECEEDSTVVNEEKSQSDNISTGLLQPTAKRKSDACDLKEMFPLEVVGSNVEVRNEELSNKRIKMEDQSQNTASDSKDILKLSQKYAFNLGMEDAIENVIRATLDSNRQKSNLVLDNSHAVLSSAFSHGNDGSENLSSLFKPASENHVYPYSLTNYAKERNLKPSTSFSPEIENSFKYNYIPPSTSVLSRALTSPPISRGSVISPTLQMQKSCTIQEQSSRQVNQNKYLLKPVNDPNYNKSKTDSGKSEEKLSVYHQKEQSNYNSKSAFYGQNRNISSAVSQSSQYIRNQTTMQIVHRSSASSDFPREFLTNAPMHSANSANSPLNLTQPKLSSVQSPQYTTTTHHTSKSSSVLRADSRYQTVDTVSKTIVKRVNESMFFQDNQLVHCDRSSVIQHTMQHVKEKNSQIRLNEVEMPNQFPVSVNSDAVEQIRNVPNKNIPIPPFTVNVADRSISSSSVAVSANLVIARKPQPPPEIPSQPVSNSIQSSTSDIITIPGILASPSVIVSPWEAQRKVHGEMLYKKNPQGIAATSTIDKRIYKNRLPYVRPLSIKPEPKVLGQKLTHDKNNNSQLLKAVVPASQNNPSVHTIPSSNQSNANASQNWVGVNKSSSTSQMPSQTTTSQPWYSEPYPKPQGTRNVSSISVGNSSGIEKNTIKLFQSGNDPKSFGLYSKQMHLSKHQATIVPALVSSLPHSTNTISHSSVKPNVHRVTTFSSPNCSTSVAANATVLDKEKISSTSNIPNYSAAAHNTVKNTPVVPSNQLSDKSQLGSELILNKSTVGYSPSNIIDNSLQFTQASQRTAQNSCCSPSELNPCQNCSLPSENNLTQPTSENVLNVHPNSTIPRREKMALEDDVISGTCNSSYAVEKEDKHELSHHNQLNCLHCGNPFSEIELQNHILKCASSNIDLNNSDLVNEMDSNIMVTENFCAKTLSDVPEQNSFFQKETFLSNLPQATKSFMNLEDDKNLDEIDANAFSACMDLINNDKDLERIVQGIDSLDQIDNNYLPYVPSTDPAENFLTNNLYNDIQNNENPLQDSATYGKINEVNVYNIDHACPPLQEKKLSVFDFTETKSVQPPVFTKPLVPCTETVQTTTSKMSNELTFADILKGVITESESVSHYEYKSNDPNEFQNSEIYIKNECDIDAHIHQNPPVDLTHCIDETGVTDADENFVQLNEIPENVKIQKCEDGYRCSHCDKIYLRKKNGEKHLSSHPNSNARLLKITLAHSKSIKSKQLKSGSKNLYCKSTDSINQALESDVKHNFPVLDGLENVNTLPKGRVKGIIKNRQTECRICGKVLTVIYLRKHMQTQHKEVKTENSSDLNDINEDPSADSISAIDSANMPCPSPLLEQDFDSSTCLSASDALKKNSSFTVTETSHNSENNDKLDDTTNVKFNFNVLEFSKDAESDSKINSCENPSLQGENLALENLKQENIPLEDSNFEEVQNFKEMQFNDIPHTKLGKRYNQKQSCHICKKSYHSKGNLERHIRVVHNQNNSKKNKQVKGVKNSKIQENHLESYTDLVKITDVNIEALCVATKEMPIPMSAELAKIEKVPNKTANSLSQSKSHDCATYSNSKGNLLKTVLQYNFTKNYKLSQKNSNVNSSGSDDKQITTSDASKNIEKDCKLPEKELPIAQKQLFEKISCSDSELKSDDKTLKLVPLKSMNEIQTETEVCSFKCHSQVNDLSVSENISNPPLDDNCKTKVNSDAKHIHLTDSENLSIHSSEISPISEIISNISKCHFGAATNKDNKKEVFEDNSLKLIIPENKDTITNTASLKKDSELCFFEDKICDQNGKDIKSDHTLDCDKNKSDLCNKESKQNPFSEKINDSSLSDNSNISHKKVEITSIVSSVCEVMGKKSGDLKNILQEKESCVINNAIVQSQFPEFISTLSEKEPCKLENISKNVSSKNKNALQDTESCKTKIMLDNRLCSLEDKSDKSMPGNAFCELEIKQDSIPKKMNDSSSFDNVSNSSEQIEEITSVASSTCEVVEKKLCDLKIISQEKESCKINNIIFESEFSELENTLLEKKFCKLEQIKLENEPAKNKNALDEKESCETEIVHDSTLRDREDNSENKLVRSNSILHEHESSKFNKSMPENEFCELEKIQNPFPEELNDSAFVDNTNICAKNVEDITSMASSISQTVGEKPCDFKDISPEKKSCVIKDVTLESEFLESENTVPKKDSCKLEKILLENESPESKNILQEKESSEERLVQDNALCNRNDNFENKSVNPNLHNHESCKTDKSMLGCESFELENTENKTCGSKDPLLENGSSFVTNAFNENDFSEQESSLQAIPCDFRKSSPKIEHSKNDILSENNSQSKNCLSNETCVLKENMPVMILFEPMNFPHKNEDLVQKSESFEMTSVEKKEESSEQKCRFCQQIVDSMENLSKHLNDFHDVPFLKKHVSQHSFEKKSTDSEDRKMSPPKLKLGSNESDSESMSDFDSPQNYSKTINHTPPQCESGSFTGDNLHTIPSATKQNITDNKTNEHKLASTTELLSKQTQSLNKNSELENPLSVQNFRPFITDFNKKKIMTSLNKFRRHSFDDTCFSAQVKEDACNIEHFHLKNKFVKSDKRKSISLPNIKIIAFPPSTPSHIECKMISTKPLILKNIYIESSLSEDTSFSSVNDSIENCKSSFDSSLSSSSSSFHNDTVPLNEITINSNIIPNRMNQPVSRISTKKYLKSKLCGRKLIIKRLHTYKRKYKKKSKSKLFSRKKIKSVKTFKPIIVTLKEATEVNKFLETHKQPIVKLVRLKENEFDCSSNKKNGAISYVKYDKINMEPIVKLEKISFPKNIVLSEEIRIKNDSVTFTKKQFVPSSTQKDGDNSTGCRKTDKSPCKSYRSLRKKAVSSKTLRAHNLSDDSIEIFDDDSSDSVQFLKTVTKEEKLKSRSQFCPTADIKPCSVVLEKYHV